MFEWNVEAKNTARRSGLNTTTIGLSSRCPAHARKKCLARDQRGQLFRSDQLRMTARLAARGRTWSVTYWFQIGLFELTNSTSFPEETTRARSAGTNSIRRAG